MSAAYTPQQNGTAERMNRTIKEKARTLLLGVDADEGLWDEAVKSAAYLHNVMPTSGKDRTPYELFHGVAPDVSGLKKWGCLAYVKRRITSYNVCYTELLRVPPMQMSML